MNTDVTVRDRFLDTYHDDALAEEFAEVRVLSPYERETGNTMFGVVRCEERTLENPKRAGVTVTD